MLCGTYASSRAEDIKGGVGVFIGSSKALKKVKSKQGSSKSKQRGRKNGAKMSPLDATGTKKQLQVNTREIEIYKELIRRNPNDASSHGSLAYVYYKSRRYQEASEYFKRAIRLRPEALWFYLQGHSLFELRRYQEAVEHLEWALSVTPQSQGARYYLALSYHCLGNRAAATKEAATLEESNKYLASELRKRLVKGAAKGARV